MPLTKLALRALAEVTRQMLDAVDETGQEPVRLRGSADAGHPLQQLAQDGRDLPAGQVRAEAEMRARCAEADVRVRCPADVEPARIGEDRLVALPLCTSSR